MYNIAEKDFTAEPGSFLLAEIQIIMSTQEISPEAEFHIEDLMDKPPDGGTKAWLSATAAIIFCTTAWGNVGSFSIFLNYYITNDIIPGKTKVEYALIGGITTFFLLFWSWLVSALVAVIHFKIVLLVGIHLQLIGMLLASWSTKYWQLILTEGVLSGLGSGFIFSTSIFIIPMWFLKKRAVVGGLVFAGSGLGGCIFSLVGQGIIDNTGDEKWALRAIAIISAGMNLVALMIVSFRNKQDDGKECISSSFEVFKQALLVPIKPKIWFCRITLSCIGYFCISNISYMILLYSISNFSSSLGISSANSAYNSAILNAAQFIGRIMLGLLSNKFGRFNVTSITAIIVMIFNFAFWMPINNYAGVLVFTIFMGLVMGYQFVTITAIASDFLGATNFRAVWCILAGINSITGMTAELMGIALVDESLKKPYTYTQVFSGVLFFVSTCFLFLLREMKVKKVLISWREEELNELQSNNSILSEKDANILITNHVETKYDIILSQNIIQYLKRMFYPISI